MIPSFTEFKNGKQFETDKEKLMSLPTYNLDEVAETGKKVFAPGEYNFTVKEAKEKTAKTGTVYTALTLEVETDNGECKVFDNIFYSDKALFKLKAFVGTTGINPPKETEDFIGSMGKAKFIVGDSGFLEVKWYITELDSAVTTVPSMPDRSVDLADIPL